ncbi:MAG: hypothetical protein V2A69_15925 [Pseudomonadota bacterium]
MLTLAVGDVLLVKQVVDPFVTPWKWRLVYLPTSTTVASGTGITAAYVLVTLATGTYSAYIGKTLFLEILNDSDIVGEQDELLISGSYNKFTELQKWLGLAGENLEYDASGTPDFENGYEKHKDITVYTDNTMLTALEEYQWDQSYVADFTPDARYQVNKVLQKSP